MASCILWPHLATADGDSIPRQRIQDAGSLPSLRPRIVAPKKNARLRGSRTTCGLLTQRRPQATKSVEHLARGLCMRGDGVTAVLADGSHDRPVGHPARHGEDVMFGDPDNAALGGRPAVDQRHLARIREADVEVDSLPIVRPLRRSALVEPGLRLTCDQGRLASRGRSGSTLSVPWPGSSYGQVSGSITMPRAFHSHPGTP